MTIPQYSGTLPALSGAQMIEVDRLMIEQYGIELIQMMENAGRCLAFLARERFLAGDPRGKRVVVLAGPGGNGGGALVGARRLHTAGARVCVVISKSETEFTPIPAQQLSTVRRLGIPVLHADQVGVIEQSDLLVDGIIGYSLRGVPYGSAADLIRWANEQSVPRLALDVPSGIDATQGVIREPVLHADATLTLALPKSGLTAEGSADYVGELYLADISVPAQLYALPTLALDVPPIFAAGDVLRLA